MTRSIESRTPRPGITSGVASIEKGGTGASDREKAVSNLGGIYSPRLDTASYVPKLTEDGKINSLHLPSFVSIGPMLIGPIVLYTTQITSYLISNFDSMSEYTVSVTDGVCVRRDDRLSFLAPATPKVVLLTLNGRTVQLTVKAPWPNKPSVSVSTSGSNSAATGIISGSPFGMVSGNTEHLRTDWELASDSSFSSILYSELHNVVNKQSWGTPPLSLGKTYYARCRYYSANGSISEWSDITSFTTKSRYSPSSEEAKVFASDKSANSNFGWNLAVDATGTRIIVGAHLASNGSLLGNYGSFYIFKRTGLSWTLEAKAAAGGLLASGIYLGYDVAIDDDGSRVAIGAPRGSNGLVSQCGSVSVYVRSGATWTLETTLYASDRAANDNFGSAVSFNGDASTLVVGSPFANPNGVSNAGAAYVFRRIGTTWTQEAKLISPTPLANDSFGNVVDISLTGIRIVIGACLSDPSSLSSAGSIFVYSRSSTVWTLEATLTASDMKANNQFGFSVSINGTGDRIATGANLASVGNKANSGAVYVFTRISGKWGQEAKIIAFDLASTDQFGFSVCLNREGDKLAVGSNLADPAGISNAGAAYIFNKVGATWTEEVKLTASDKEANDNFGCCVALSSDSGRLIVGSYLEDPGGTSNAGSLYVYS